MEQKLNDPIEKTQEITNYDIALKYFYDGNYETALQLLLKIEESVKDSQINSSIGTCYFNLKQLDNAKKYWNKAIEYEDNISPSAFLNLGNLEYSSNNFSKSIEFWLQCLMLEPNNEICNLNLSNAYREKKMFENMIYFLKKYLKFANENTRTTPQYQNTFKFINELIYKSNYCNNLAKINFSKNNLHRTLKFLIESTKLYPYQKDVFFHLINLFYNDYNFEKAIEYYFKYYRIHKIHNQIIYKIAYCFEKQKDLPLAYCCYQHFLNLSSSLDNYKQIIETRMTGLIRQIFQKEETLQTYITKAKQFEKDNEYEMALFYYQNYSILSEKNSNDEQIKDNISKVKAFIDPEAIFIQKKFELLTKSYLNGDINKAETYCNKLLEIIDRNSPHYLKAQQYKQKIIYEKKINK